MSDDRERPWFKPVLYAAAAYNLAFGGFVGLFPETYFHWVEMQVPHYPSLWQCIGMIVACYGVGFAFAARAPMVLWPIVLVGLLGKLLGPLGFGFAVATGEIPVRFGYVLLTNDLIWWVPFTWIVIAGWRQHPYFSRAA